MNWKLKKHDLLGLLPEALVLTRTRDHDLRYLSFDDGPDPEHTPRLLDTLARHNVKASFFLVGEKIEQYPEIVQRIVADGHMIGNHSYSHWSFRNMNLRKQLDEVYRTDALLRLFDNRPHHRMRPPMAMSARSCCCISPGASAVSSTGRTTASTTRTDRSRHSSRACATIRPPPATSC